jgi:hypothetical protein
VICSASSLQTNKNMARHGMARDGMDKGRFGFICILVFVFDDDMIRGEIR